MGIIDKIFKSSEGNKKEKMIPPLSEKTRKTIEMLNKEQEMVAKKESNQKLDNVEIENKEPKNVVETSKVSEYDNSVKSNNTSSYIYNKPERIKDRKLVILLIENSLDVYKYKEEIKMIIKNAILGNLVCTINYSSNVEEDYFSKYKDVLSSLVFSNTNTSKNLYDSIKRLNDIILENNYKTIDIDFEKNKIKEIEVIGFGTCVDNMSNISKEYIQRLFSDISYRSNIKTKYFCLTEKNIIDAAEIGFRSIGVIERKY